MKYAAAFIVFLALMSGLPLSLGAGPELAQPLVIDAGFAEVQVAPHVELLRDPGNELTISQVDRPPWSDRFKPNQDKSISLGMDYSSYWFRFRLACGPGVKGLPDMILAVTRPKVDEVDVFLPEAGGSPHSFKRLRAGIKNFAHGDDLGHRIRAVALPPGIPTGQYIYVRVRSNVVCYALTLFSLQAFDHYNRFEYLFFGLTTGIMLAMLIYNLGISIFLRDRVYAAYCAYMASMVFYSALLTGWPLGLGLSPGILVDFVLKLFTTTFFFAAIFARRFLNTRGRHPVIHHTFSVVMMLSALVLVLDSFGHYNLANSIAHVMGLVVPVFMVVSAAMVWRGGYLPARYYLLAWSVLLLLTMIYSTSALGLIGYSFVVYNLVLIGAAAESMLLSLALADRIRLMRAERVEMKERERRLTELSITDDLTGLYNKRWFSSKLNSEMEHAGRLARPLSLIILDIDNFKDYNDARGHAAGDRVLAELGGLFKKVLRTEDIPCRYGGEEFTVLLPGLHSTQAVKAAERLRIAFAEKWRAAAGNGGRAVTLSAGVAQMAEDDTPDSLFERADRALYQAKADGRNRVVAV